METEESELEIIDEGAENSDIVCGCCTGGSGNARQ